MTDASSIRIFPLTAVREPYRGCYIRRTMLIDCCDSNAIFALCPVEATDIRRHPTAKLYLRQYPSAYEPRPPTNREGTFTTMIW